MPQARRSPLDSSLVASLRSQLRSDGRSIRKRLAPRGEIVIERPLPFLACHRLPPGVKRSEIASFIARETCFAVLPANAGSTGVDVVQVLVEALAARFGALLLVEVWAGPKVSAATTAGGSAPGFRVITAPESANSSTLRRLVGSLERIEMFHQHADVALETQTAIAPPDQNPLLSDADANRLRVLVVGIEVRPNYLDPANGAPFPMAFRSLKRQLGPALRRAAYEFARRETRHRARHFESLGRRAFTKRVWEIDREITAISEQFDLLLVTTPTNGGSAYQEFEKSGFEQTPTFLYRPRAIDPPLLKRDLYRIPIERVDDPTLAFLFEEKRRELDLKLTMVEELHTRRFLPAGLALYGTVDASLVAEARRLLELFPAARASAPAAKIDAGDFAQRAEKLLERLRDEAPGLSARVLMRDDVSSLTVSAGTLLIGRSMTFAEDRAEALLQHEVGTHVVTHWNGSHQPLSLLSVGLAGYDELQEGLAVFAEYLVGGLNPLRLRTLAGRVLAARSMTEGASFVETFHELTRDYGFGSRAAFTNTMRVYRGGGFVKDAVYLRGLRAVLGYVRDGGHLESLLIGKVATDHAPMIEELQHREVLQPLALMPTYLRDPSSRARLKRAEQGITLEQLVES